MPDGAVAMVIRACAVCGGAADPRSRTGRCAEHHGEFVHVVGPRAHLRTISLHLPYSEDTVAQRFVEEHPDGGTLEECGAAFGVTRERIRQIEARALERLRKRCQLAGIAAEDLAAVLANRRSSTEHMDVHGGATTAKPIEYGPRGSLSWAHAAAADIAPKLVPEELYSSRGRRFAEAVADLEEVAAIVTEIVRRAAALDAGVDPGPIPAALLIDHAPPLEAQRRESTMSERASRSYTVNGETLTLNEWGTKLGIEPSTLRMRIAKGWSVEDALTSPLETKRPGASPRGKAKPARKARPIAETARETADAIVHSLDPAELLRSIGYLVRDCGAAPNGHRILILEGLRKETRT